MEEDDLITIVEDHIRSESHERKPKTLFVSEIGYCKRKVYFKYHKKVSSDLDSQKTFYRGDITHEDITDILSDSHLSIETERPVTLYLPSVRFRLSGRADELIYGDSNRVLEKKSTKNINTTKKYGYNEHHKIQLMLYMGAIGFPKGTLFYADNEYGLAQFNFDMDWEYFEDKCLARARDIAKHIKNKTIPEAEAKITDKRWISWINSNGKRQACNPDYCPYREVCYNMSEEEIEDDDLEWTEDIGD